MKALNATGGISTVRDASGNVTSVTAVQNVFDGRTSTLPIPDGGGTVSVATYFQNHPSVNAITYNDVVFVGAGFFAQTAVGRAGSMIHEGVVHMGFRRRDAEFDTQGRQAEGSRAINSVIDRHYRAQTPQPVQQ